MRGLSRAAITTLSIAVLVLAQAGPSGAAIAGAPLCFGERATLVGTSGHDDLAGGPDDVVVGLGGDDSLSGGTVCGGGGNDSLWGVREGSRIDGGSGDDMLRGDAGPADVLLGGAGNDYVADEGDTDYPDMDDPGTDVMEGGPGNDHLVSTSGRNLVYGNAGDDRIYDYTHVETVISGGPGNDAMYATGDNYGSNPYEPDIVAGDGGRDAAQVNRIDKVSSSTENVTYVD